MDNLLHVSVLSGEFYSETSVTKMSGLAISLRVEICFLDSNSSIAEDFGSTLVVT